MNTHYNSLLSSPKWFEKRKIILNRDNNKCLGCGSKDGLQVHHRQYHIDKKTGKFVLPWNYKTKNLITLCAVCHLAGHSLYKVPVFEI